MGLGIRVGEEGASRERGGGGGSYSSLVKVLGSRQKVSIRPLPSKMERAVGADGGNNAPERKKGEERNEERKKFFANCLPALVPGRRA